MSLCLNSSLAYKYDYVLSLFVLPCYYPCSLTFQQITRWFIKISLVDTRHNRNAGNFSDAAGEREMALKCWSLPRDAGDLAGLLLGSRYHITSQHVAVAVRKIQTVQTAHHLAECSSKWRLRQETSDFRLHVDRR